MKDHLSPDTVEKYGPLLEQVPKSQEQAPDTVAHVQS